MTKEGSLFSLLLVDDHPMIITTLKRQFMKEGYKIYTAGDGTKALAVLEKQKINAAIVDLKMPGMDGMTLLKKINKLYPDLMVIILTATGGVKEAVEAMKIGAVDFLEKPFSPEGIKARVSQLALIWQLRENNRRLRKKIEFQFGYDRLIGSSPAALQLKEMISQAGPTDATVLIEGDTGTGKELVARALHHHSARSDKKFVPVDCGAINETVIESELFGHAKGAYTGAYTATLGLLRDADQGTLFLDEIGELSLAMQAKLLRVIQEGEIRPVGSDKVYHSDFRVVAATNRDLAQEVSKGRFRDDLYFRLNVLHIRVPSLEERQQDIGVLARNFIEKFHSTGSIATDISPEALLELERYHWPGNIRELENIIKRSLALSQHQVIQPDDLPDHVRGSNSEEFVTQDPLLHQDSMAAYEQTAIKNALRKSNNNRRLASSLLGISEATLYRKLQRYQL